MKHNEKKTFTTEVKDCGAKGKGLFNKGIIEPDTFVIAYIAEVISKEEQEIRRKKYESKGIIPNFFGTGNFTLDATKYGSDAKYCNHSCDPNMNTQRWIVDGAPANFRGIGFIANRRIGDEELTINYGDDYSEEMECFCNSENCAGIVGKKPKNLKKSKKAQNENSAPQDAVEEPELAVGAKPVKAKVVRKRKPESTSSEVVKKRARKGIVKTTKAKVTQRASLTCSVKKAVKKKKTVNATTSDARTSNTGTASASTSNATTTNASSSEGVTQKARPGTATKSRVKAKATGRVAASTSRISKKKKTAKAATSSSNTSNTGTSDATASRVTKTKAKASKAKAPKATTANAKTSKTRASEASTSSASTSSARSSTVAVIKTQARGLVAKKSQTKSKATARVSPTGSTSKISKKKKADTNSNAGIFKTKTSNATASKKNQSKDTKAKATTSKTKNSKAQTGRNKS